MKKNQLAAGHKQNLVDKAVQYLTREILADRLRPNQRISEVAVCEQLGISRSPVREALRMGSFSLCAVGHALAHVNLSASADAVLISYTDEPLLRTLGILREENDAGQ